MGYLAAFATGGADEYLSQRRDDRLEDKVIASEGRGGGGGGGGVPGGSNTFGPGQQEADNPGSTGGGGMGSGNSPSDAEGTPF